MQGYTLVTFGSSGFIRVMRTDDTHTHTHTGLVVAAPLLSHSATNYKAIMHIHQNVSRHRQLHPLCTVIDRRQNGQCTHAVRLLQVCPPAVLFTLSLVRNQVQGVQVPGWPSFVSPLQNNT